MDEGTNACAPTHCVEPRALLLMHAMFAVCRLRQLQVQQQQPRQPPWQPAGVPPWWCQQAPAHQQGSAWWVWVGGIVIESVSGGAGLGGARGCRLGRGGVGKKLLKRHCNEEGVQGKGELL